MNFIMPSHHLNLDQKVRRQIMIYTGSTAITIVLIMRTVGYWMGLLPEQFRWPTNLFILSMGLVVLLNWLAVPGSIDVGLVVTTLVTGLVLYGLGSIQSPAAAVLLVLVIMAGILVGVRGILMVAASSLAVLGTITYLEITGVVSPRLAATSWFHFGTYTFLVAGTTWVAFFIVSQLSIANQEISRRLKQNEALQEELIKQALHDPLTGLFNRRYLNEMLEKEFIRCHREGLPLSVIVADLDLFKQINDTYGHKAGDEVLVAMANYLQSAVRASDFCCRYGGEEFVLVLPGADRETAYTRAELMRAQLEEISVAHEMNGIRFTASFGVATSPDDGDDIDSLLSRADAAQYKSKQNGRNRVTAWYYMPAIPSA